MTTENIILVVVYVVVVISVSALVFRARKQKELRSARLTAVLFISAFIPVVNVAVLATWIFRTFGDVRDQ